MSKEDLEQLFKEWKKAQLENSSVHKYFCKDGYINKKEYDKSEKKILFILKEPNVGKEIRLGTWKEDNQVGFYKDFFDIENYKQNNNKELIMTKKTDKSNYYFFDNLPRQKEKIARIAEYILNKNITDDYKVLKNALSKVAFMNLNKSGGYRKSDNKYFNNYCNNEIFSKLILEEIQIINPNIIILIGGNSYKETLDKKIFSKIKKDIKIISIYHTSAMGKSLNINKEETQKLNHILNQNYNYNEKLNSVIEQYSNKNRLHLRKNKNVFKYLLKFILVYE